MPHPAKLGESLMRLAAEDDCKGLKVIAKAIQRSDASVAGNSFSAPPTSQQTPYPRALERRTGQKQNQSVRN
ncbi:hypothetical protein [Pseudomonas atagonensis]|uniref:hypothetical protein n=1 Tax=Pseudomonas atagonensis TaxID=2609964 RepID=UPI00140DF916|nr:hypothetical protein [Pseudomonas atagonensis]